VVFHGPVATVARADVVDDRGHELRIRYRGGSGWVVVSDVYAPGWTAELDGDSRPILPVDYAFRAVAVPEGDHELAFRYSPW
jgi:uncharacterized membrane protein YfhO